MITEPTIVELGPFSAPGAVHTPWADTADRLRRTQKYWLTTVRPDARPHVTPLLATPALRGLCFVTGRAERKSRNLVQNPNVVLTTGSNTLAGNDIVVEGIASVRTDEAERAEAAATFESNLGWHVTHPDGNWYGMADEIRNGAADVWEILPRRGFAHTDGRHFSQTRYVWSVER